MKDLDKIRNEIGRLGSELVHCEEQCRAIANDMGSGRIPRCLVLEERRGKNGVIIVGINPGRARSGEKNFYLQQGASYDSFKRFWEGEAGGKPKPKEKKYYRRLRKIADSLGYDGPILWTELVKCELDEKERKIPVQTLRTCIKKYLEEEIEICDGYPIIAVGNQAYNFISLRFPDKLVIGIPHPTGSYGTFDSLLDEDKDLKARYKREVEKEKKDTENPAIRLFPKKGT